MKHTVAMATLNEGPSLEMTIASLMAGDSPPHEILVLDDAGVIPVGKRLDGFPNVKVVRSEKRLGCGRARHFLCGMAEGDLITVCDSHMVFRRDALSIIESEHRYNPLAVLCPTTYDTMSQSGPHGPGCNMVSQGAFYSAQWANSWAHTGGSVRRIPCVLGACYTVTADMLKAIGGFAPALCTYGVDEPYLSIRAWICGFEVKGVPHAAVEHRFHRSGVRANRSTVDNPSGDWEYEIATNNHIAARVCFGDSTYESYFAPRDQMNETIRLRIASVDDEIKDAQQTIARNRTRSNREVAAICGITIPD